MSGLTSHFSLSGDLSLHELPPRLPQLLADFDRLLSSGAELSVDLSALLGVDTSSLAFLLELSRRAKKAGSRLRFVGAPETLKSLARLSSVDELLAL